MNKESGREKDIERAIGMTLSDLKAPIHMKAKILFKENYHKIRFNRRYGAIMFMGFTMKVIDTKEAFTPYLVTS